jgi:hypothetical protein
VSPILAAPDRLVAGDVTDVAGLDRHYLQVQWHVTYVDSGDLVSLQTAKRALWSAAEADGRLLVGTGSGSLMVFDQSTWAL